MRKDTAHIMAICDVCKETKIKIPMVLVDGAGYNYGHPAAKLEKHGWVVDIELDPQIVITDICPECAVAWHAEREAVASANVTEWKTALAEEGF